MITKKQYLILKKIYKNEVVKHDKFSAEEICSEPFNELLSINFIEGLSPVDICGHIIPTEYRITPAGIRAYEEYNRAEKSNRNAKIALFFSGGAVIVSMIGVIVQALI